MRYQQNIMWLFEIHKPNLRPNTWY